MDHTISKKILRKLSNYQAITKIHSDKLSEINQTIIKEICKKLDIKTKFYNSSEFVDLGNITNPSARLVNICKKKNINFYVTGPLAKNYLEESLFRKNNIEVEWFNYDYLEPDINIPVGNLSIIDTLMNYGLDKSKFLK